MGFGSLLGGSVFPPLRAVRELQTIHVGGAYRKRTEDPQGAPQNHTFLGLTQGGPDICN